MGINSSKFSAATIKETCAPIAQLIMFLESRLCALEK